jgi:hypothetical protein
LRKDSTLIPAVDSNHFSNAVYIHMNHACPLSFNRTSTRTTCTPTRAQPHVSANPPTPTSSRKKQETHARARVASHGTRRAQGKKGVDLFVPRPRAAFFHETRRDQGSTGRMGGGTPWCRRARLELPSTFGNAMTILADDRGRRLE